MNIRRDGTVITFGEIMMRLSPPGFRTFGQANSFDAIYGGGESNVAVSLANYGHDAAFVSRIPAHEIGDCAVRELRRQGVNTEHIIRGGDRLGIYFIEHGASIRGSKVVYDRANSGMATIAPGTVDWKQVFDGASWFHWTGITPAISRAAADVCLEAVLAARAEGLTISCDLNYRKKLWNYGATPKEIMPALVEHCDILIGNEEDAYEHFGIKAPGVKVDDDKSIDPKAYKSVCDQLQSKFASLRIIAITLRGSINASHNRWSAILFEGETLHQSTQYDLTPIVDRVGAGDSFCGGLIYGLRTYEQPQDALNFATAASALKHTYFGDANGASKEEVVKLMQGNTSGRVSR